jgi:hypothetical protein
MTNFSIIRVGGRHDTPTEDTLIEYEVKIDDEHRYSAWSTYGRHSYWCDELGIEHCGSFNQLQTAVKESLKMINQNIED